MLGFVKKTAQYPTLFPKGSKIIIFDKSNVQLKNQNNTFSNKLRIKVCTIQNANTLALLNGSRIAASICAASLQHKGVTPMSSAANRSW